MRGGGTLSSPLTLATASLASLAGMYTNAYLNFMSTFSTCTIKKIIKIGIFLRKIYTLISHMLMSANS
jgi:hypothetical protein